jgi:PhzF family phenazine biosynthesis protein
MNDPMVMQLMLVDAFARKAFMGNPAAVCWIPDKWPSPEWLQRFAAEMNQSETAFVGREGDQFRLRWFSPVTEVDLCGHATLAAAHSLLSWGFADRGLMKFQTKSGLLTAEPLDDGMIRLDFPVESATPTPTPAGLIEALGTRSRVIYVGKNRFDYLVHLATPTDVGTLKPDMLELAKIDCRGVIVTAAGEGHYDFVSRFFAPRYGIPEDPVTGSAHCCLAPYWSVRSGRTRMLGFQASQRGGEVRVEVVAKRVLLSGKALTISTGQVALA